MVDARESISQTGRRARRGHDLVLRLAFRSFRQVGNWLLHSELAPYLWRDRQIGMSCPARRGEDLLLVTVQWHPKACLINVLRTYGASAMYFDNKYILTPCCQPT